MPDRKLSALDSVTSPVQGTDSIVGFRSGAKGIRILLSDFLTWLNGVVAPAWANVTGKPSTFSPSAHTHPVADLSDSTAAGRALVTGADAAAQRSSLGLGDAATKNTGSSAGQVAAGDHTHALSGLTQSGASSGQVAMWNGSAWAPADRSLLPRVTSAAYASSITPNSATTDLLVVGTLTGNVTIENPSGTPADGQNMRMRFVQDGTGRTISWGTAYAWGSDVPSSLVPTTGGARFEVGFSYSSADSKWRALAIARGF